MQALENRILALLLGQVVDTGDALLARRQRPRLLFAEEVRFLLETVATASVAVVFGCGRCRAQVERFLFYAFFEQLGCGVGGVGALEEGLRDVRFWGGHFFPFLSPVPFFLFVSLVLGVGVVLKEVFGVVAWLERNCSVIGTFCWADKVRFITGLPFWDDGI